MLDRSGRSEAKNFLDCFKLGELNDGKPLKASFHWTVLARQHGPPKRSGSLPPLASEAMCGFDQERVDLYESQGCFAFLLSSYAGNYAKDTPGLMYLGKIRIRDLDKYHMTLSARLHSLFPGRGKW